MIKIICDKCGDITYGYDIMSCMSEVCSCGKEHFKITDNYEDILPKKSEDTIK